MTLDKPFTPLARWRSARRPCAAIRPCAPWGGRRSPALRVLREVRRAPSRAGGSGERRRARLEALRLQRPLQRPSRRAPRGRCWRWAARRRSIVSWGRSTYGACTWWACSRSWAPAAPRSALSSRSRPPRLPQVRAARARHNAASESWRRGPPRGPHTPRRAAVRVRSPGSLRWAGRKLHHGPVASTPWQRTFQGFRSSGRGHCRWDKHAQAYPRSRHSPKLCACFAGAGGAL